MTNSEAFEAGYDAYWDGVGTEDNPYEQEQNVDEFRSWSEGWQEAQKHDFDESEG
jgi:hypothetical protein